MSFFDRPLPAAEPPIRLWNHDPELFEALSPQDQREVQLQAVAPALRLDVGPWSRRLMPEVDTSSHLGLLVVEGLLVRTITVAGNARSEVIGPGALIRPWDDEDDVPTTPTATHWDVIEPTRLAILDPDFLTTICPWPPVASALIGRTIRRSRWLGQHSPSPTCAGSTTGCCCSSGTSPTAGDRCAATASWCPCASLTTCWLSSWARSGPR